MPPHCEKKLMRAVRDGTPLRFSVVVIFHNQRDFVQPALDTALGQLADEVIAVDDGSTDGTRQVLDDYRDRVRLVLLEHNQGASAARNAGAAAATGDYLIYLDGDDAFMPWALETYRLVAEEQAPALIMAPMYWFDQAQLPDPGASPTRVRYIVYKDYFAKEQVVEISASVIVVSSRVLESVGGWDGFPMEDLDLVYRLGTTGPFVQITEPCVTWHRSHARQTIRQTKQMLKGVNWLISNDKNGRYPGGRSRRFERRACIGGIALHWARTQVKAGPRHRAGAFLARNAVYVVAPSLHER